VKKKQVYKYIRGLIMNPSKRKRLARLELAKKQEEVKQPASVPEVVLEATKPASSVEEPVAAEVPAPAVEESVVSTPVVSSKKKKS
jgi:glycine cleavage system H lipoate-binding protein